jgi:hypothetical protein
MEMLMMYLREVNPILRIGAINHGDGKSSLLKKGRPSEKIHGFSNQLSISSSMNIKYIT